MERPKTKNQLDSSHYHRSILDSLRRGDSASGNHARTRLRLDIEDQSRDASFIRVSTNRQLGDIIPVRILSSHVGALTTGDFTAGQFAVSWRESILGRYGLRFLAVLLLLGGVWLLYVTLQTNHIVEQQVHAYNKQVDANSNSGAKPPSGNGSSGDTNQTSDSSQAALPTITDPRAPRHISIPALGISASMTVVGLNKKDEVGIPANIHYASWYDNSSSPRDKIGNALIVGHVGSPRYKGAFYNLDQAKTGQKVTVAMANGTTYTYKITAIESLPEDQIDMASVLSYLNATSRILHLMTCTGDYSQNTFSFNERLIVTAVEA